MFTYLISAKKNKIFERKTDNKYATHPNAFAPITSMCRQVSPTTPNQRPL